MFIIMNKFNHNYVHNLLSLLRIIIMFFFFYFNGFWQENDVTRQQNLNFNQWRNKILGNFGGG